MKLNWIEAWAIGQLVGSVRKQPLLDAIDNREYTVAGAIFADWLRQRFGGK